MDATTKRGAIGVGLVGLGFLALILGWSQLRASDIVAEQICFAASGGLGGLVLVLAGSGLIASSNSHLQSERLERIDAILRREAEENVS